MDANKKPVIALNDGERFPLITDLSYLNELKQDEFAPAFNFQSGDRLRQHHLQQVHAYARQLKTKIFWEEEAHPPWLNDYIRRCINTVPFYSGRKGYLENQPTISRRELQEVPWRFVSTDCDLNDILVYQTSGTTGPPMDVVFDPVSQACWIPQLESILEAHGILLTGGADTTSIALICSQQSTLTYASLSTYLKGAGILKINLNPNEWKDPAHRAGYLEKYNPEILTGDPFAFLSMLELKPRITPKALVSSAMKVTQGIRKKLESYFKCPVLDIYSLTECRMIAVAEGDTAYRAIRPDIYLEIFDRNKDIPVKPGERGELVITGGNNPFLPLIRYRTGDFCSLKFENNIPYLIDLEARQPVAFYRPDNTFINNVDISREMMQYPLAGFTLHQEADKNLVFTGYTSELGLKDEILKSLRKIFGKDLSIEVLVKESRGTVDLKPVSYSSAIGPLLIP